MDYKEKYEQALERCRKLYNEAKANEYASDIDDYETIFPELRESEDERIRKAQLDYWRSVGGKEWHGVPVQEVIAWLEKQSDTNETINNDELAQSVLRGAAINLITWIDYNAAEGNMCLSNVQCREIENALVSGNWNKIYAYMKKKLERQDEQKPIFNVVDWQPSKVDGKIHNIYNSGVESKFHKDDYIK